MDSRLIRRVIITVAVTSLVNGATATQPPPAASRPAESAPATPASQPATRPATGELKVVKPFADVTVFVNAEAPDDSRVEVAGLTCLDSGWLEQIACAPATREHESLIVLNANPSQIHAALLMAGFEPGKPGRWKYENDKFSVVKPTGARLEILVRYSDRTGKTVEHSIARWIRQPETPKAEAKDFPHEAWVFGGSVIEKNTPDMGPGEHYVADMTGSIIGLVTFGDEVIGFSEVRSDQDSVQEPTWEANPEMMPEVGTPVTIVIRKWKD